MHVLQSVGHKVKEHTGKLGGLQAYKELSYTG